jgi:hypothetical protein
MNSCNSHRSRIFSAWQMRARNTFEYGVAGAVTSYKFPGEESPSFVAGPGLPGGGTLRLAKAPLRELHQVPPAFGIGGAPRRAGHFDECVFSGVEGVAAMVLVHPPFGLSQPALDLGGGGIADVPARTRGVSLELAQPAGAQAQFLCEPAQHADR